MRYSLICIFLIVIFGCRQTSKSEFQAASDTLSKQNSLSDIETPKEQGEELIDEWRKFDLVFDYNDTDQNLKQKLGIRWIVIDSVEFKLYTEDDICDTDYRGNAKLLKTHAVIDSAYSTAGSFPVERYIVDTEDYYIELKIGFDLDMAQIQYTDRTGIETDCIPTSNLVLKKNAR